MELETGLATPPEELSLRDELARNLAEAAPEEEPPQKEQAPAETDARTRDEQGRFAPKEEKPAQPELAQPEQTAHPKPARPSSWKKDFWQDFDKIAAENPKLAQYLNERESQFASGVSTYKQEWEQAKPLIDAVAPFQPLLQQHGIDPAQWVSNLGNAHRSLAMGSPQEKLAMFQRLIGDYGIPAQLAIQGQDGNWQLLGQQQPQQQQPAFDPSMVTRLVEQKLMETSTQQALEAFTQEAPQKYPHFEVVKQTMAGLLQAGLANDLPSAYEAALRHPRHADLFEQMQQQQREQQEAAAREASRAKVTRARSQAVSTPSATPSGQMNAGGEKGLRDEIAANLRAAVGGRV